MLTSRRDELGLSRRAFLAKAALFACAYSRLGRRLSAGAGPSLRVGALSLTATPHDARAMGLTLGAEEAARAAALFGGAFQLVPVAFSDTKLKGFSALIGEADCPRTIEMVRRAKSAGIPFFNVGCASDDLRAAECSATAFHVAPSEAMRRDTRAAAHVDGDVVAWHPSLVRFGADTLNRRFTERFAQPMSSDAWTAWLATKIIWESGLRAASGHPERIIEYLGRDSTQFDGHKGLPLSFRSWDHQLRQPLYVVNGSTVVDVPSGTAAGEPARDVLDRIGTGSSASACRMKS